MPVAGVGDGAGVAGLAAGDAAGGLLGGGRLPYWASMPSFSITQRLGAQLGDAGLGHAEELGQVLGLAALEEVARRSRGGGARAAAPRRRAGRRAARGSRAPRAAPMESSASTSTRVRSSSESLTSCSRASTTERNMRSCRRLSSSRFMPSASAISCDVRHPAELGGQALLDGLELAGEGAHRAGGPVGGPDGIEDRAADALGGEAVERARPGTRRSGGPPRPGRGRRRWPAPRGRRGGGSAPPPGTRCGAPAAGAAR